MNLKYVFSYYIFALIIFLIVVLSLTLLVIRLLLILNHFHHLGVLFYLMLFDTRWALFVFWYHYPISGRPSSRGMLSVMTCPLSAEGAYLLDYVSNLGDLSIGKFCNLLVIWLFITVYFLYSFIPLLIY